MEGLSGFDFASDSRAREHVRRPLRKPARLVLDDEKSFDVKTIDISLNGICVLAQAPMPVGQKCSVAVEVFFKNQSKTIVLEGKVIYCLLKGMDGFRTGICATQINSEGTQYINALFQ